MNGKADLEQLVERVKQGDISAFGRIYDTMFDQVYGYVYRQVGRRAEAEDITSGVFLSAFEKINGFTWQGAGFNAWVFRIAHNSVVDHFRRQGRPVFTADLEEELLEHPAGADVEEIIDTAWKDDELYAAIDDLPDEQKQVILLRLMVNFSNREIGEVLSKSEGAVKALQHRAMTNLRKMLSGGNMIEDG